jgi:hypothetical protein
MWGAQEAVAEMLAEFGREVPWRAIVSNLGASSF